LIIALYLGSVIVLLVTLYLTGTSEGHVANYLEFHYHAEWERLGRPGFLTGGASIASRWSMTGFLFTQRYRKFRDAELNKIATKALVLQIVSAVMLLLFAGYLSHFGKPPGV
jgi:hypothetical protein